MQHVVDPRLAAGRGEEFRVEAIRQRQAEELELQRLDDGDFRLPLSRFIEENVDLEETECASLDRAIPASNVGYRLLQKLGWRPGGGLGREQQGRVDPVRMHANDTGTRIGLGRAQVERQYIAAEFVERRALEVEIQADEDEERKRKRELEAERQQKIREEVKHELRMFYCEICRKQYQFAHEMEEHLSSYDHHHRKRLAETRAMLSERSRKDRSKKERRAAEKEAARMAAQVRAAQVAAGIKQPSPPPLPPPSLEGDGEAPPLPPDGADGAPPPPLPPGESDGEGTGGGGGWLTEPASRGGGGGGGGGWQSARDDEAQGGWGSGGGGQQQEERGGWGGAAQPPHGLQQQQQQQPARSLFVSSGWRDISMAGTEEKTEAPLLPPPPFPLSQQQPQQQQQQQGWSGTAAAGAAGVAAAAYDPFAPDADLPLAGPAAGAAPMPPLAHAHPAAAAVGGVASPLPLPLLNAAPLPSAPPPPPAATSAPLLPPPPAAAAPAEAPPLPPPPAPAAAAPPLPPPPAAAAAAPPPPRPAAVSLSLGFGAAAAKKPVGGFSLGGAKKGKPAAAPKRPAVFGSDSEDEEDGG